MYWQTKRHFRNYNNRFDIAINTFPIAARKVSDVYYTGFHKWKSDECITYSVVIYRFRIMLYHYTNAGGDCQCCS